MLCKWQLWSIYKHSPLFQVVDIEKDVSSEGYKYQIIGEKKFHTLILRESQY